MVEIKEKRGIEVVDMCPEDPEGTNKIELLSFTHIRL